VTPPIPDHDPNPDTRTAESLQIFDAAALPKPEAAKARLRPANRPRSAEAIESGPVQEFVDQAVPASPGTKGKPRPIGRERRQPATKPALGDVVALRSGGPPMTIIGFGDHQTMRRDPDGAEYIWCAWFQVDGYRREALPRAALVPAGT
jgi:uncharacterized protein YodC (DUF2158 family)